MARSKKKNGRVMRIQEQRQELTPNRKNFVTLIPRNLAQEKYIADLHDTTQRIVFATGPAGTGKTYLCVQKAIQEFMNGVTSHIVITRPTVTVDEELGFLPGDINAKLAPWTRPIFDIFEEYYSTKEVRSMVEEGAVEVCPLAFMRGRTFKNCTIIFDESQNSSEAQMQMCLTRIGENSRMFITGDLRQSDLKGGKNGLQAFTERLAQVGSSTISLTNFSQSDIERDPIVTEVLRCYGEIGQCAK